MPPNFYGPIVGDCTRRNEIDFKMASFEIDGRVFRKVYYMQGDSKYFAFRVVLREHELHLLNVLHLARHVYYIFKVYSKDIEKKDVAMEQFRA